MPIILSYTEVRSGGFQLQAKPSQAKSLQDGKKLSMLAHTCHPSYTEGIKYQDCSQASQGKKSKTLREK
jgi:hypothetical protein